MAKGNFELKLKVDGVPIFQGKGLDFDEVRKKVKELGDIYD